MVLGIAWLCGKEKREAKKRQSSYYGFTCLVGIGRCHFREETWECGECGAALRQVHFLLALLPPSLEGQPPLR